MTIGGHPGGAAHAFAGALDDMAIFTRVITEAEINTIIKGWAVEPAEKLAITWAQIGRFQARYWFDVGWLLLEL